MAAGLARQGMIPVFAVYSSFLQRGYDQLIHDIALQDLHVVLGVDRAGLVGADGETHHGCFDALFLSEIPGFTVLCPASFAELRRMLRQALFEVGGPVAVRYPRGGEGDYRDDRSDGPLAELRPGTDVTILTYGTLVNQALAAADLLARQGVSARVLKLNQIAPLDFDLLAPALAGTDTLAVAEDAFGAGCVGQRAAAILAEHGAGPEKADPEESGQDLPAGGHGGAAAAPCRHRRRGHRPGGTGGENMSGKKRLDVLLVERGLQESRQKAQAIIMSGEVFVAGQRVDKPGTAVPEDAQIAVRGALPYVSRGGLKLEKAMARSPSTCTAPCAPTSGPPPAALPTVCCKTARRRSTPWTWATASWPGSSARIRGWCAWSGPTPGI